MEDRIRFSGERPSHRIAVSTISFSGKPEPLYTYCAENADQRGLILFKEIYRRKADQMVLIGDYLALLKIRAVGLLPCWM